MRVPVPPARMTAFIDVRAACADVSPDEPFHYDGVARAMTAVPFFPAHDVRGVLYVNTRRNAERDRVFYCSKGKLL